MINSKKLERVTGSAAVSSGSLPDVFRFLPWLWQKGIEWKREKSKVAMPSKMLEQNIPQIYHPWVALWALSFSAVSSSKKLPDIFWESSRFW